MHKFFFPYIFLYFFTINKVNAQVKIKETDSSVSLSNKYASFEFDKKTADLKSISYENYNNLLGDKGSAYLSGPNWTMTPSTFSITSQNDTLIDISFKHTAKKYFNYDLHYVIKSDTKGIYVYLVENHSKNDPASIYEQTRWGLRADPSIFNYHLVRDTIQGPMYSMDSLESGKKLQDWTYKMSNGIIYTKYNYADYIDNRYVHGMAGTQSHVGIFVIQASHEYLNGGPTKQYQTVHSNPYLINMFNCTHFLNDNRVTDDTISGDWTKLNGPFLLYVDKEKSVSELWNIAKQETGLQKKQWPYAWLQNKYYPLERGTLVLNAKDEFNKNLYNVTLVLADSGYDWQAQTKSYIYWTHTNKNGYSTIKNIRPGVYTLYAYGANRLKEGKKQNIIIVKNESKNVSVIMPTEDKTTIWQIGDADRTTRGFKYADHKRAYGLFDSIPENLDYTIGKSIIQNWYYAQTKVGNWKIHFTNKNISNKDSIELEIAIAGVARNPKLTILLNDQPIGDLNNLGNDHSIYRSAILGGYYILKKFKIPINLINSDNTLELKLEKVPRGGGYMYDAIRLSKLN
ncbi:polysaccharide lyase family protein [Rhizosphaericola mali]|uniref:Rhamnogalacturonan endolyase n=1 Tax=Rhizosphaericola mali TaxID=2545455 RepID=A0A5P2G9C9_9BACT|nr:polysaccharide lyase family protein [Rhizosphaericola mali]QES88121.1 hypothetical protein E0W69_005395 [Rhizosphaericola mali]